MSFSRILFFCTIFLTAAVSPLFGFIEDIGKLNTEDFKRLRAESWHASGKNIIVEGNVYLPIKNLEIYADKIIINTENDDFEAIGNVRLLRWENVVAVLTLKELAERERQGNVKVNKITSQSDIFGERTYKADMDYQLDNITADRIVGNLTGPYFRMDNLCMHYTTFVCRAKSGEHLADGVTVIKDGEISACGYLESHNAHYSIAASEFKLLPHKTRFYGVGSMDLDPGDRAVLVTNGFIKIYGLPVLWLPFFYKPKDESPGIADMVWGKDGDWGYYVNFSKRFVFSKNPELKVKLHADYYSRRGFGYGASGRIAAPESRTEFFAYGIYDLKPFATDDYDKYRLDVPHARYNFRVSNLTHITPRLDFRGTFEMSSDRYMRRDFFSERYLADPQPATFAALEQQFDRLSASVYMRFRVNDFYTAAEKIPEVRLEAPRQEIFNTGLYYQGDLSAAYMRMRWLKFDEYPRGYTKLKNYDTFRLNTTHFLYYPVSNRFFNFVPRAGFNLTAYSSTSKKAVNDAELMKMFAAASPESKGKINFRNYDNHGSAKVRFAAELGFELSTKIHGAWKNARNAFFEVDGLRHVMQPYINYTFITKPNVNREHIYYFDDVDRLEEQNFIRFGMYNRIQTRKNNAVTDLFTMENYWDLHMKRQDGYSALGNFGTVMKWKIFKGLSLDTKFLIDISGDQEVQDTIRHGRNVGKTGLALKWLNQWDISLRYAPATNWEFAIGYNYTRPYSMRNAYSMGSTLTQINATSSFLRDYDTTDEVAYFNMKMPLTPDHRTLGAFSISYDFAEGSIDTATLSVMRKFHCMQLIASVEFEREYDDGWHWDVAYSIQANLTGLNSVMNEMQNSVMRGFSPSNGGFSF